MGRVMEDGRAELSQGLLTSAGSSAAKTVEYLEPLMRAGYDVLFAEPSVLAMMRQEYRGLVKDTRSVATIQEHCFDPMEYLDQLINGNVVSREELRRRIRNDGVQLFYHGHCQLKSIGAGSAVPVFFEKLGFEIEVSTAECCGMAGSFGYKKQYYALSKNIGDDLCVQIEEAAGTKENVVVLASGTSCREQISGGRGGQCLSPYRISDDAEVAAPRIASTCVQRFLRLDLLVHFLGFPTESRKVQYLIYILQP